jgi:hypothetical protein
MSTRYNVGIVGYSWAATRRHRCDVEGTRHRRDVVAMRHAVAGSKVKVCACFECRYSSQFLATKSMIDSGLLEAVVRAIAHEIVRRVPILFLLHGQSGVRPSEFGHDRSGTRLAARPVFRGDSVRNCP